MMGQVVFWLWANKNFTPFHIFLSAQLTHYCTYVNLLCRYTGLEQLFHVLLPFSQGRLVLMDSVWNSWDKVEWQFKARKQINPMVFKSIGMPSGIALVSEFLLYSFVYVDRSCRDLFSYMRI